MNAEERIVTLQLLGCAFWRRPSTSANDPDTRWIYQPEYDGRTAPANQRLLWSNVGRQTYKWRCFMASTVVTNIEIEFDPRLIDRIPETLFMQFIRNHTR